MLAVHKDPAPPAVLRPCSYQYTKKANKIARHHVSLPLVMPGVVYAQALPLQMSLVPAAAASVGYFTRTVCEQNV